LSITVNHRAKRQIPFERVNLTAFALKAKEAAAQKREQLRVSCTSDPLAGVWRLDYFLKALLFTY
jgi:hypothetical protein